jgi:tRNA(Ile)-lysidine synthase
MENLLDEFQKSLLRLGVAKKDRLLLAVSGGLDSVVLTFLCVNAGLDFAIAHANFQLRGEESERDEAFVRRLAIQIDKILFTERFDTIRHAGIEKSSIQVTARNLRYEWFKLLLTSEIEPFKFVLTAHHLDDNVETMLIHFFRGTGISGLTGMPEKNNHLIRPLLKISRSRLKDFAIAQKLAWVEDSSNNSNDYTRNFFRNQLIPSLTNIFPDIHTNLEKNLQRFSEAEILYQRAIHLHKKKLMIPTGSEIHIPILLMKKAVPVKTLMYEIIKNYHFSPVQTEEAIHLMDSMNGKYISSATHRIIKNRRWLIIAHLEDSSIAHISIDKNESVVDYPDGRIHIKEVVTERTTGLSAEPGSEVLDAAEIQFPLLLRKWKAGDYFYPLGMKKKKKLARFLIDQKLSKTVKEKVWVLAMDNRIIWVVGQRIDNRFRTTDSTAKILVVRNETKNI